MEEIMIDLTLVSPKDTILEAMEHLRYDFKGIFRYDYPELNHKWYERIKTELFEKEGKLYYFAGVPEWKDDKISVIRIGKIENKLDKNPECIFT